MALSQSLPLRIPLFPSQSSSLPTRKNLTLLPKLPLKTPKISFTIPSCSSSSAAKPSTEQDILEIIADSDGADVNSLPCVRTYENDLARLTVVGAVGFEQAITAAAADGGEAAKEHIAYGMPAMVAETVFPGHSDDHSTISTRLFLPARKVKERAKSLKTYLTEDVLSGTTSTNILAMTFRQVVLQQLWNFELVLFRPGTVRNMKDLENSREVPASFTLSSSDEWAISMLAEVVSTSALESAERSFVENSLGRSSYNLFRLFYKPERIVSKDSSVILYKLLEDELVRNAKSLLEKFNSTKATYKPMAAKLKCSWWTPSVYSKLEKIGGPQFSTWVCEYVPAYRLQINSDKLHNLKFEGWKESTENRWEVLLTHSQMVCLANILDMYYEDLFTLPDKQLSCGAAAKSTNMPINKKSNSLLKMLSVVLASGFFMVAVTVVRQLYFPHVHIGRKYPGGIHSLQLSHTDSIHHLSLESTLLEDFCVLILRKVKDAFGWTGEIKKESGSSAWIGNLPVYLRREVQAASNNIDISSTLSDNSDEEIKASAQYIASYQVVLSAEGEIVGFQPTNRLAVNNWAANPLAKELHGGRNLSPGLLEPSLKINHPSKVVILELLMSINQDSYFALVRPVEVAEDS